MKRFEYNVLTRIIVKAESREQAETLVPPKYFGEVGRVVREETWFQLPGEEVIEAPPAAPVKFVDRPLKESLLHERAVDGLREFLRSNKKISKHLIAKRMGVNSASIYSWIKGKWKPEKESVEKILNFLARESGENH